MEVRQEGKEARAIKEEPKGKGGGKGYRGYCFDCGLQGHKRGEPACWFHQGSAPMQMDAIEKSDGARTEFGGGSWGLAQVQVVPGEAKRSGDRLCDPLMSSNAKPPGWRMVAVCWETGWL